MFTTPTLTISLSAIVANWQLLRSKFTGEECAAVVKADGYGLGAVEVATALAKAGCHTFFVATIEEGIELRAALPDVRILILHGVLKGEEFAFAAHRLIPILNSLEQMERWKPVAAEHVHAVSALHIDTAMARAGLQVKEFGALMARDPSILEACRVGLIMSHLASSPDANDPLNAKQLTRFNAARMHAPNIPASLCNSGGIFLSPDYHFHLARPGCSLYGIAPQSEGKNPMHHVATWNAPILTTRVLEQEQTVGYGGTATAKTGTRIATVQSGYADGYLRSLSNNALGYVGPHQARLIGRVTMDMLCFDVTDVPEHLLHEGASITLLGDHDGIRVDDLAHAAGTIGYEILTRIGPRVKRIYV